MLGMGPLAVDDVLHVERYPPADRKVPIIRTWRNTGGLIGTALAAAARLGARCAYAGILGSDDLARFVRKEIEAADIDGRNLIERPDAGPVHSVILADERTGTRNIFYDVSRVQPFPPDRMDSPLIGNDRVLLIDQLDIEGMTFAADCAQ